MTEKRVLLAAMISALFLSWYSKFLTPPKPAVKPSTQEILATPQKQPQLHDSQHMVEEGVVTIESSELEAEIGTSSGSIRKVSLKNFPDETKLHPISFGGKVAPIMALANEDGRFSWNMLEHSTTKAVFDIKDKEQNSYRVSYELDDTNPIIHIKLFKLLQIKEKGSTATIYSSWFYSTKADRSNIMEAVAVLEPQKGKKKYQRYTWHKSKTIEVPRGTQILSLSERYFCQSNKYESADIISQSLIPSKDPAMSAQTTINLLGKDQSDEPVLSLKMYVGPRDFFYLKKSGMDEAFHIGFIEKIGLVLLSILTFIAEMTKNYGVAIILFSILITLLTAPFTLLNFKSMKKMRELKPQIDKLMAQHKGDQTKASKEIFALYKEHKVSPISGCLPILFQIPIFIALFKALSHYVQLRGQTFLWIQDLSLPDRLWHLPFSAPILGEYLNLLPIITAIVMFMQTKLSSSGMETDKSNPAANIASSPLMAVVFGFMFYNISSGLVLYWMMNSLTSLCLYRLAK